MVASSHTTYEQTTPHIYKNRLTFANKSARLIWNCVYTFFFRPTPVPFHGWRRFLLRVFGAHIEPGAAPYPRCRIWAPWNLHMGVNSCIANDAECYSVAHISIGPNASISQYALLCTASHDYNSRDFVLVSRPITIGADAWIAARAFIGPGVTIGEGAVVGAAASVFRDVPPWAVVRGNPAVEIKRRNRIVRLDS